jgi:hypothetical protein
MIELASTSPDVEVQPAEYKRLLGYPPRRALSPRARRLARWARAWYAEQGRPWTYARQAANLEISAGSVLVDGVPLASGRLQQTLTEADAHGVVLVAVSAGPEIEQEAHRAWQEGKPDEYFFLETFGSAVVEQLATTVGAGLCAWADGQGMAVLPHSSPGYSGWDVAEQPRLLELIRQTREHALPGHVDVLDSGMLRPKKSLLAVFGLTRHVDRVGRLSELVPCEACSFQPCQYRRRPYARANGQPAAAPILQIEAPQPAIAAAVAPLQHAARYAVNRKALARWAAERLKLRRRADGSLDAVFQYEGTTCTNLGRLLTFDYHVTLGPRDEGYPIRAEKCGPTPGDQGHTTMCSYLENPDEVLGAIAGDRPLVGRPLDDVLAWQPPTSAAGCYCTTDDRLHKWRIVLETLHYALAQQESGATPSTPTAAVTS